jgi:peptide/nickel transport system substrate-binding protein
MKSRRLRYESLAGTFLLAALAIFLILSPLPARSAAEPGTVIIVGPVEPDNVDSGSTATSDIGRIILKNVVEPLTEINPDDSSVNPRLALSWKQTDATTWQFFLRKGVKFHDGGDFNAEAVVYNIKRLYDKKLNPRLKNKYFADFTMEGKALDSLTVEIKTSRFQPLLPTLLGTLTMCSPNTPMDKMTRNPVGTGPYRFAKWDPGVQIILERFDGYWGKQPQVKKAVYVWRGESSVRAAMVAIGEADIAATIAVQDAKRPGMDYSYFNAETSSLRIGGVWEPPLNDRRVRMALNYAVDRDAIRGTILSKDVVPATQMVVPNIFGYNPDLKVWPYDPPKARQLLDEARRDGVPVDKEITLLGRIGYFPGSDELMETLLTMYKAVGFNAKLKMIDNTLFQTVYNRKPYAPGPQLLQKQVDNNNGDAVFTVYQYYHCKGDVSPMCDKMTDELIEKAQLATGEERRKLFQAAFKRAHEEVVPYVMLYYMVGYTRVGSRINFKPSLATNSELQLAQITFK